MSLTGKPALTTSADITNDGFWPTLSVGELMSKYRIPAEYADDTIIWGLTLALVNVNMALEPVKADIVALGFVSLTAYTTAHPHVINSNPLLDTLYKHAVFSRAKAGLLMQFNSMNRRRLPKMPPKKRRKQNLLAG